MAHSDAMTNGTADNGRTAAQTRPSVWARTYGGMTSDAERGFGDDAGVLLRIVRLALRHKVRLYLAGGAIVCAAVFQLMIPRFLGSAVDGALGLLGSGQVSREAASSALMHAALLLLGASVMRGVFTLIHNYCGETVGHHVAYHLRLAFYRKLQQLSFSFHDRVHTGELITRGMLDLEGVRAFMNTGPLRVLLLVILIGGGAYMLLSADVWLGLLSLSFVPFVTWRSATARLKLRELWYALQDKMGVIGRIMDENLTGIRVVRAFGAEPYELRKYDNASDEALAIAAERVRTRVSSTAAMAFAYLAAMGLVLWVGGLRVLDGQMTVGKLTEFLTFMTILQQPVRQLGLVINSFARASTCGARLFAVLDLEPAVRDAAGAKPLTMTDGTLRFENVSLA